MNLARPTRRRLVALVAAAAALAGACGGNDDPLEIGFRRIALDLAFKDAAKAEPVEPTQVIRQFVEPEVTFSVEEVVETEPREPTVRRVVRTVPRQQQRSCPTAPEGATPATPAFAVVKEPPKVGSYARHNEGTLNIALATSNFDLPVPALSTWQIGRSEFVSASVLAADQDVDALAPPPEVRGNTTAFPEVPEFELTRRLLPGYSVTDTFRYTYTDEPGGDYLYLVKRVRVTQGKESTFTPSPPIRIVRLNVPEGNLADAGVVHAGVDKATGVAMAVQSQILSRELVDVCGEVVDTYRVQIKENVVDLSKEVPETSGNEGETANYWNIQFDNGLLIVREEVHSTYRTTTEVLGQPVPVIITYDYTSTLDSLQPGPLAPASSGVPPRSGGAPQSEEVEE
jgi:hypothetical protein